MITPHKSFAVACFLVWLAGCTPNPNVPEPPPPPPVAPVVPLPVNPVPTPMVNPASLPGDPDKPAVPQPVEPAPAPGQTKSVTELAGDLAKSKDRQAAAAALAAHGKEALPALTEALENADWQVRAAAVFALGKLGQDAAPAKDKLQTIAEKDENEEVRVAAAFALDALAE